MRNYRTAHDGGLPRWHCRLSPACRPRVGGRTRPKLGKNADAVGAEKAGNAAGTIPAWDGGITKAAAGLQGRRHYPDPFGGDKPLFTITRPTRSKYKANLSPGADGDAEEVPRRTRWSSIPRRRSASFPAGHYKETRRTPPRQARRRAATASWADAGGIPFPIPKDGLRGRSGTTCCVPRRHLRDELEPGGGHARRRLHPGEVRVRVRLLATATVTSRRTQREDQQASSTSCRTVTAPARLAGQILLVHEDARPGEAAAPGLDLQPRPAPRAPRAQRRPTTTPARRPTACAPTTTSTCSTARPTATTGSWWARRRCTSRTTPTRLIGNKLKYADILKPGHINPDTRALRAAPRLGGRGDAQARHQPHLQAPHLLHRRGQLADGRRRTSTTAAASCGATPSSTARTGTTSR